jgi:hypothetical protein
MYLAGIKIILLLNSKMIIMKSKTQLASLVILIVATTTTAVSCKKADVKSKQKTKTELLTSGSRKRTGLTATPAYDWYGDGTYATNLLSVMKVCDSDNFDSYKSDGTGVTDEGQTRCDESDPQAWPFVWEFADNETKLVFDYFAEYTLVELTETTLKFRSTFEKNGVTYTIDETYSH